MKQSVKERLNKKLSDNNMTLLSVKPIQQRLYQNGINDSSECQNRLINNTDNENVPYGNGLYDDRVYNDRQYNNRQHNNDYLVLQESETTTPFWRSLSIGNEQLVIVVLAGLTAYALYVLSKAKDK